MLTSKFSVVTDSFLGDQFASIFCIPLSDLIRPPISEDRVYIHGQRHEVNDFFHPIGILHVNILIETYFFVLASMVTAVGLLLLRTVGYKSNMIPG